jgi:hypothetical protein
MSDTTTPATATQDQSATLPTVDNAPPPATVLAVTDETTDATPEQGDTATLAGANKTLRRFGSLCRAQADHNYALAETAALYVGQYLGASDKATRSRAVENLADEWLLWDEETLALPKSRATTRMKERVNLLLRVNAVRVLLGDGRDVQKGDGTEAGRGKGKKGSPIPWGKLRELAPLVDRDPADNVETWAALGDAVAEKGRALVVEIAASGLNRRDVVDAVRKIAAGHYSNRVTELRRIADAAPDDKDAQWAVQRAEKQAAQWVDKVAEDKLEPPEVEATEGEAEDVGTEEQATPPAPQPQPRAVSLPQMAKEGTAKDVAEMCRELVEGNDQPDDVLATLLGMLKDSGSLSRKAQRACNAALVILHREDKAPTPAVEIAGLNGHPAGAVA